MTKVSLHRHKMAGKLPPIKIRIITKFGLALPVLAVPIFTFAFAPKPEKASLTIVNAFDALRKLH